MGKSNKQKKKKKEADFVKPKLKVGKKKPTAANATSIAFKSSAINVLAQLEEKAEPTNRRNLSLKDLLTQLTHYNDNTRKDATQALKDFFIQYPMSLHQNLSLIIPKLLSKAVDAHFGVRKGFLTCLEHILKTTAANQIQPFFPIIMAHMNCAMTHINDGIQSDSIDFMDLCLDSFPEIFLKYCDKVLHSFLDLVSHNQTSVSHKKGVHNKGKSKMVGRDLSTKPSGKMSTLAVKISVLEKLLKIVLLVFKSKTNPDNDLAKSSDCHTKISGNKTNIFLLKYELLDYDKKDQTDVSDHCNVINEISNCGKMVRSLILSFMPVLFSVWNDCNPSRDHVSNAEKENQVLLPTMKTIILIMKTIVSFVENDENLDFANLYYNDFIKDVLHFFPIDLTTTAQSKHLKSYDSNQDIFYINVAICEISCCMIAKKPKESVEKYFEYIVKIANYIQSKCSSRGVKNWTDQLAAIQTVLCHLVSFCSQIPAENVKMKESLFAVVTGIAQNLMAGYKMSKSCTVKCKLLAVLENLLKFKDLPNLSRVNRDLVHTLEDWLVMLPGDLLAMPDPKDQSGLKRMMSLITSVIIQKRSPLKLVDSLGISISHVVCASLSSLEQLQTVASCDFLGRERLKYVIAEDQIEQEIGCDESYTVSCSEFVILISVKKKDTVSHERFCVGILDMLVSMDCGKDAFGVLLLPLSKILEKCRVLPEFTVVGILLLLYRIGNLERVIPDDQEQAIRERITEFLFFVIFNESRRKKSLGKNGIDRRTDLVACVSKVLEINPCLIRRIICMASTEQSDGVIDDELIVKSIWNMKRQQHIQDRVNSILEEIQFEKLRTLIDKKALYTL
eukprot:gene14359-5404_t